MKVSLHAVCLYTNPPLCSLCPAPPGAGGGPAVVCGGHHQVVPAGRQRQQGAGRSSSGRGQAAGAGETLSQQGCFICGFVALNGQGWRIAETPNSCAFTRMLPAHVLPPLAANGGLHPQHHRIPAQPHTSSHPPPFYLQLASLQLQLQGNALQQAAESATKHAAAAQQRLDEAIEEAARLRAEASGLERQLALLQQQVADLKASLGVPIQPLGTMLWAALFVLVFTSSAHDRLMPRARKLDVPPLNPGEPCPRGHPLSAEGGRELHDGDRERGASVRGCSGGHALLGRPGFKEQEELDTTASHRSEAAPRTVLLLCWAESGAPRPVPSRVQAQNARLLASLQQRDEDASKMLQQVSTRVPEAFDAQISLDEAVLMAVQVGLLPMCQHHALAMQATAAALERQQLAEERADADAAARRNQQAASLAQQRMAELESRVQVSGHSMGMRNASCLLLGLGRRQNICRERSGGMTHRLPRTSRKAYQFSFSQGLLHKGAHAQGAPMGGASTHGAVAQMPQAGWLLTSSFKTCPETLPRRRGCCTSWTRCRAKRAPRRRGLRPWTPSCTAASKRWRRRRCAMPACLEPSRRSPADNLRACRMPCMGRLLI